MSIVRNDKTINLMGNLMPSSPAITSNDVVTCHLLKNFEDSKMKAGMIF